MRTSILIALSVAAALSAGAAFAQTDAPTTTDTAVNPPAASSDASAPAGGFASSDTLGDASKMKAGDPNVVSNNPVPDTPENRAALGGPRSNAGRHTDPTGD